MKNVLNRICVLKDEKVVLAAGKNDKVLLEKELEIYRKN